MSDTPSASSAIPVDTPDSLHRAIAMHHNEVLPRICANDLTTRNEYGYTLLMEAALAGNVEAARHLCAMGADVHAEGPNGNTALHLSARNGGQVAAVLLEAGADPFVENNDEETPLIHALVQKNGPSLLPLLRAYKEEDIDIDGESDGGIPAVILAAHTYRTEELRLMLTMGGYWGSLDNDGNTPLMFAVKRGQTNAVRVLLEAGADLNTANSESETPLHWAVRLNHTEIISLLLEAGGDPNVRDNGGHTPLSIAFTHGQFGIVALLAEHGADVTERFPMKKFDFFYKPSILMDSIGPKGLTREEMCALKPLFSAFSQANKAYNDEHGEESFDYLMLALYYLRPDIARLLVRCNPQILCPETEEAYYRFDHYSYEE